MLIPPAPTAPCPWNFCKCEEHYPSTWEAKHNAETDLTFRIMPGTNMANIYLDVEDGSKDDPDFHLNTHIDKDDRMRDVYNTCIRICPM